MGQCNIDHSHKDVEKKLESQQDFLPNELHERLHRFLEIEHSQETLNDLFHLLKKYDLSTESEQEDRNAKMAALAS